MPYHFVTQRPNYADFSSGQVFYSQPGRPAFPVRLASEIFQRCLAIREANQLTTPVVLYDPCCGSAYHLCALAYLHWQSISEIIASDIDEEAVQLARRNLNLLSLAGLDRRTDEIFSLLQQYQKESHQIALESARTLRQQVVEAQSQIETQIFQANGLSGETLQRHLLGQPIDVVFADVPYGQHSQWQGVAASDNPVGLMLEALLGVLSPTSLVAIAADKAQKISHNGYRRVEHFKIGKRVVAILRPYKLR